MVKIYLFNKGKIKMHVPLREAEESLVPLGKGSVITLPLAKDCFFSLSFETPLTKLGVFIKNASPFLARGCVKERSEDMPLTEEHKQQRSEL